MDYRGRQTDRVRQWRSAQRGPLLAHVDHIPLWPILIRCRIDSNCNNKLISSGRCRPVPVVVVVVMVALLMMIIQLEHRICRCPPNMTQAAVVKICICSSRRRRTRSRGPAERPLINVIVHRFGASTEFRPSSIRGPRSRRSSRKTKSPLRPGAPSESHSVPILAARSTVSWTDS